VLAIDHDEVVADRSEQLDEIRRMAADDRAEHHLSLGQLRFRRIRTHGVSISLRGFRIRASSTVTIIPVTVLPRQTTPAADSLMFPDETLVAFRPRLVFHASARRSGAGEEPMNQGIEQEDPAPAGSAAIRRTSA
jgi:hypothetical protein